MKNKIITINKCKNYRIQHKEESTVKECEYMTDTWNYGKYA